jgi:hypothetical protein
VLSHSFMRPSLLELTQTGNSMTAMGRHCPMTG